MMHRAALSHFVLIHITLLLIDLRTATAVEKSLPAFLLRVIDSYVSTQAKSDSIYITFRKLLPRCHNIAAAPA